MTAGSPGFDGAAAAPAGATAAALSAPAFVEWRTSNPRAAARITATNAATKRTRTRRASSSAEEGKNGLEVGWQRRGERQMLARARMLEPQGRGVEERPVQRKVGTHTAVANVARHG